MNQHPLTDAECADMDETAEFGVDNAEDLATLDRKPRIHPRAQEDPET